MTSPAFPQPLPSGANLECYPYELEEAWDTVRDTFESGTFGTRRRWYYPPRRLRLSGQNLTEADIQEAMGFLRSRSCGAEAFYIQNYHANLWRPYDAPTLDETAGGTLAQRTYHVQFTWYDTTLGETTASEETSKLVAANKLLTLTVEPFPKHVTAIRIYASSIGASQETLVSKLETDGGTWTEPMTVINGDSASGQPILNVSSSSGFQAGDRLLLDSGGDKASSKIVSTTGAGTITMTTNLDYSYVGIDNDPVQINAGLSGVAVPTTGTFRAELKVKMVNNPVVIRTDAQHWQLEIEVLEDLS